MPPNADDGHSKVESLETRSARLTTFSRLKQIFSQYLDIGKTPYFALALTFTYFLVGLFAAFHHEMWRDEIQAWLLARDSTGVFDLLRHMKYEGHPALWHLLLIPITRLTASPTGMQILHLLIATSTVFLVTRNSPLTPLQKVCFAFGYYSLYEYGVVCRNYAVSLLLVTILCTLLRQRYQKPIPVALILFLMSHTSVHALVLVISVALGLGLDYLLTRQDLAEDSTVSILRINLGFAIITVGILTAVLQLNPPADTGFAVGWYTQLDLKRIENFIRLIPRAFFPIPNRDLHFWGSEFLMQSKTFAWFKTWKLQIACLILVLVIVATLDRPSALLIYLSSTFGLLAFFYIKYQGAIRHHGFIFIAFLLTIWGGKHFRSYFQLPGRFHAATRISFNLLLTGILFIHLVGGLRAVANEIKYPFSYGKLTAEFIRAKKLDILPMIGDIDYAASTVVGYLGKKEVYYVRGSRKGSFVRWDSQRTHGVNDTQVMQKAAEVSGQTHTHVLLILNHRLSVDLLATHPVEQLVEFTGSTIGDEGFYLYLYQPSVTEFFVPE